MISNETVQALINCIEHVLAVSEDGSFDDIDFEMLRDTLTDAIDERSTHKDQ